MDVKNRAQLKAAARGHLTGVYGRIILVSIFYLLLSMIVTGFMPDYSTAESAGSLVVLAVIAVLVQVFARILRAGLLHAYMKLCCNERPSNADIISGLKAGHIENLFWISLILVIIQNLSILPSTIYYYMYKPSGVYGFCIYAGILVAGVVADYMITLGFSQCVYLVFDFPDKTWKEIVKLSFYLMKGNYGRYIALDASFIPMIALGTLSFGIGFLWVLPYVLTTKCCFYLNLVKVKSK